ncbi:MAG: hypothetical protein M3Z22_04815 [Verrucomicrobiota bacterium]|nr:hypothetical protein [Verrucomicrobiota bacterium]
MILLALWLLPCLIAANIATKKGRSGGGFFLLSFFLSPLVGIIAALVVQPNVAGIESAQVRTGAARRCPCCAETIQREAKVCRYCGRDVTIHVSRDGEEIAVVTSDVAEAALRSGRFSRDDWAWGEGYPDWIPLNIIFPIAAPSAPDGVAPWLSRREMLVLGAAALSLLLLLVIGLLAPDQSSFSQKQDSNGYSSTPTFKGDRNGNLTQEDYEKAAKWLLDRDKERQ